MSSVWTNHASHLIGLVDSNKETQAHLYLEQLMLFPVDIQDKIIDDISRLQHCDKEAVANILGKYSMMEL